MEIFTVYGIPISRIKELIDLFLEDGYNLRDDNVIARIKLGHFPSQVKKDDSSQGVKKWN